MKKIARDDNEGVIEENEKLLTQVSSLKKETKELRRELEQKSINTTPQTHTEVQRQKCRHAPTDEHSFALS